MFFISGITGHVGGAAARKLLAQGHKVRTLARNPEKAAALAAQGVEVLQGSFTETAALTAALQGVEAAFIMNPPNIAPEPGFPDAKANAASFAQALRQTSTARVVVLSSIGSEQTSGLGLITGTHILEQALSDLPNVAFVRAGGFFENFAASLAPAAQPGIFYTFYQPPDLAVPMIATDHIGIQVANQLTADWSGRRIIELGTSYTVDQIAAAIGRVVGRSVTAQPIPRDRWSATFESFGMPPGTTGAYEEMIEAFNSGWIPFGVPGTEPVPATLTAEQAFVSFYQAEK